MTIQELKKIFEERPAPSMSLTLNELQFTEADEEGDILKKDRNKLEQRADGLDCVRYSFNTWLSDFLDKRIIR